MDSNIEMLNNKIQNSDFDILRERVASQCLCCGSYKILSSSAILMPFVAHRVFNWRPVQISHDWGLNTINNGYAYSICNSLLCSVCEFLFLDIRFSEKELKNLYHNYRDAEYNSLREEYEPGYSKRNDDLNGGINYLNDIESFILPHVTLPVTILDWGGDTGKNTPFKSNNNLIHIYDIGGKGAESSAVIVGKKEAFNNEYSLVVCCNVLEHVPFPLDVLQDITKTMSKRSLLYIEVPFEDIFVKYKDNFHIHKKHWHEHINFFSEKSIKALITNAGFVIVNMKRHFVISGGKSQYILQIVCKLI